MNNIEHLEEVRENRYPWMSDNQFKCFQMLDEFFAGLHHIDGKIKEHGGGIEVSTYQNKFSTFDFDGLTRLVIIAHDRAVRAELSQSGPRMIKIILHYRGKREGRMHERHPTLEEAIENIRN